LSLGYVYDRDVAVTTGNDKMVAVNVKVPRSLRDALNEVAKARKWSIATTVREAIQRLVDDEEFTPASPKS
jgi:predicted transcriptional regulator